MIGIDQWRLNTAYDTCTGLDFHAARASRSWPTRLRGCSTASAPKYREYGVSDEPFVVVKADAGTYGMGIMMVRMPPGDRAQSQAAQQDERHQEGLEVTT